MMVLDVYFGSFTIKYYELEAYVDELLRSNPSSTLMVEMCKEYLKKGTRVFKRIFFFV